MLRTLVWLALWVACQAQALPPAPSCWTVNGAVGYSMGKSSEGMYAAWWCPDAAGDWALFTLIMRTDYVLKHPATLPGAAPADVALAYWRENVTIDCGAPVPTQTDANLCNAARTAGMATRPPPAFVVRPNGTAKTRPTYPLVAGVRGTVSNGTVSILDATGRATACNPNEKIGTGASTYMQVKGIPGTVALCKAAP
jgi:hypothetical protein